MSPIIALLGEMPVDALQGLFASIDPMQTARKFLNFALLDPQNPKASVFVALEDWLNDGVPLAGPVAQECLSRPATAAFSLPFAEHEARFLADRRCSRSEKRTARCLPGGPNPRDRV